MDIQREVADVLDLISEPAFLVQQRIITQVNYAARSMLIEAGTPIDTLLHSHHKAYDDYTGGCLYLTLDVSGLNVKACVTRMDGQDVFILDKAGSPDLRVLSLAARELREPLSRVMNAAEKLYDPAHNEEALKLNRGLYQILRILGNMSEAGSSDNRSHQETVNICALIRETFEKAQALLSPAGISIQFSAPEEPVYALADAEQLERAVLNILSNAAKFTPSGGSVSAQLTHKDGMLVLRIQDNGCGIADSLLPTLFTRFTRQNGVEDSRHGLGLGMVLIRAAAENHGGTVLIDRPEEGGTRITFTMAVRRNTETVLHSPIFRVDYAGGLDHALVELSDVLPAECFGNGN